MKKISTTLVVVLLSVVAFAQTARVQVIHNSADAAASTVDVWLNNTLLLDDFDFRTASPFIDAPAGVPLEIRIKGPNSVDTTNPIALFPLTLAANETYVVVADGIVSPTGYSPSPAFNLEIYNMGREAATSGSNTDLLVHHGSTDAPVVDVAEVGVVNATIVDDLAYTEFQGYLELPTADYTLQILDGAGITPVAAFEAPLATLGLQGAAGVVVASGFLNPANNSNGPAFGLYVALPTGGPLVALPAANNFGARAQFIHNSADAAAQQVDVYLNDVLAVDNFEFRTATPFLDLPAGVPFDLTIQPANSTDTTNALAKFTYTLDNGATYVGVADGIVSGAGYNPAPGFDIEIYDMAREQASSGGNTDVLVHHGSTDAPTVDVAEVSAVNGIIVDNLAYTNFQGYLELPTADYTLQILDEDAITPVAAFDAPLASLNLQGAAAVVVASGFLDPSNNSNGPAFGLFAALPSGGPLVALPAADNNAARAQVIHNSADAAAEQVDVYFNSTLVLDNFEFRTASPFVDVPANLPFDVTIQPSNSTDTTNALAQFTYQLMDDGTYVIVADGIVSPSGYSPAPGFNLEVYDMGREAASNSSNTDVLVHHGSTDAPTVDVAEVSAVNGVIVDNLSYTDFQGYLELPTADYTLQLLDESATTPIAAYDAPLSTLNLQGAALVVVASGFLDPSSNSNGPAFGLWAALPAGGPLVELPSADNNAARMQVIHNSADAAAQQVDVYLNDVLALDNFEFRTASPFIDVPANLPFDVTIQPSNSTDTANALAKFTYQLMDDATYVVVADGIVSGSGYNPSPGFNLEVYDMGREAATNASNTDVLVHHGSTDAPIVDVAEVGVVNATIVNDLSYTDFQGYLELPTADYTLQILDQNGTTPVAAYEAPLSTLNLQGQALVVVASGFLDPSANSNGPAFGLFAALPTGGNLVALPSTDNYGARAQIIHNSPDAAAQQVDVYLNEALALDNFEFRTATPFINLPAGVPFDVTIQPANSTDTSNALAQFTYTLTKDEGYTIIADGIVVPTGYSPAPSFNLEVYAGAREAATTAGNTDVLVHHGSTDAPAVDIAEVDKAQVTLANDLVYTDFAGYLELPTDNYILQLLDANGTTPIATYGASLDGLGLRDDAITVIASGFLDPSQNNNGAAFGLFVATANGGPLVPLPTTTTATAKIQVIHNSADAAAAQVDVYLNENLAIDNFAFRTATPYIEVPAGVPFDVTIQPSNSSDTTNALAQFTYTLEANENYVIVADGIVSPTGYTPSPVFNLEVYVGGREASNLPGNTDVLVHHGSTDAPTVDVAEVGVVNATIVDNLSYTDFQGYLELPTNDYILQILDETGSTTVAAFGAPLNTLGLEDQALVVVASGFLDPSVNSNGEAFGLYAALPTGGPLVALPGGTNSTARVQIIHNSADAAASQVDVYVNDNLVADNFAFRTATPFIDVPGGIAFDVVIQPSTSTDTTNALARFNYMLMPGSTHVIVADGIVSGTGYSPAPAFDLEVYSMGREAASVATNTDVLVHHGSTDAPAVDVAEVGVVNATIIDDLAYTDFQGYLELPTADYTLQILDASGTTPIAAFGAPLSTLSLQGQALVVVASGFVNPAANSNGPAFGLYAALPAGGPLVALPAAANATAKAQIIHNAADIGAAQVDVYLNDQLLLDNFAFRTATPFVDVPAGLPIDVVVQPSNSSDTTNALARFNYTLTAGETYVIVADGIASAGGYTPLRPFDLSVYAGGREAANNASNVDVLVHHGSTDAPTVDVAEVSAVNNVILDNLSYGDFQGYLELPTNDYKLQVLNESGTQTVAAFGAPLQTLGLQGGAAVVVASGFLDPSVNGQGPAFGLYAALPTGGPLVALPASTNANASVQVIHNSADLAAERVDIWLNDEKILDNFRFRTSTPFVNIPAETPVIVSIAGPASTDTAGALAQFTYKLDDGENYIIVANGIVSPSGYSPVEPFDLYVYTPARQAANNNGETDVLVFHGATDAPTVDVAEIGQGAGTIVDNLAYGDFQGYLELPTTSYRLAVQDQTGSTTVAVFDAPLDALGLQNAAITVLASGFLTPANNSDGADFGLYVALPNGGALVPLPVTTGIQSNPITASGLYPNPTTNGARLEFTLEEGQEVGYMVVDIQGRMVAGENLGTLSAGSHYTRLNTNNFAAGMYKVILTTKSGATTLNLTVQR